MTSSTQTTESSNCALILINDERLAEQYDDCNTFIHNVEFKFINSPNYNSQIIKLAINPNFTYNDFKKEFDKIVKTIVRGEDNATDDVIYDIIHFEETENGFNIVYYLKNVLGLNISDLKMSDVLSIFKCPFNNSHSFYVKVNSIVDNDSDSNERN